MKKLSTLLFVLSLTLCLSNYASAQEETGNAGESKEETSGNDAKKGKEKTYTDIITKEAVTDSGLFIVHQVKNKKTNTILKSRSICSNRRSW
jgi:hypothetical protein